MGYGLSFGPSPIQPSPQASSEAMLSSATKPQSLAKDFELLARTAAVAAQIGTSSFFRDLNTNRYYASRMALFASITREDDTFDKKRRKEVIRRLKPESSEATRDQLR